jgi:hypothetical protein
VPGQPEPADPRERVYRWRTLDPTPHGGGDDAGAGNWLSLANTWVGTWFRDYVTNYTPEQRQKALTDLVARLARPETPLALVAIVGLVFGARFARRRLAARAIRVEPPPPPARWFGKLAEVLAAHGIVPAPGETALEFARGAAFALRERPGCAAAAEVPLAWADAYYQDRFGGTPPTAERLAELEAGLDALRRALETRGS